MYGGEAGVASLIEAGRTAAQREGQTGQPQLIPAGYHRDDALMPMDGYYLDPQRGMIQQWENTLISHHGKVG